MSNTLKWEDLHALFLFAKRYEDKDGTAIGSLLDRMRETLKLGLVEDRAVIILPPGTGLIIESSVVESGASADLVSMLKGE